MSYNAQALPTRIIQSEESAAAEAEFVRTHVSRYILPTKLAAAESKGAAKVTVPTADMARLLARLGEHVAAAQTPEVGPLIPPALQALPVELAEFFDWDGGEAIVSRAQVEALIGQVVRIAFTAPRPPVRRVAVLTVPDMVSAALAAGKASVSVPTDQLRAMLDTVDAEREAARLKAEEVAA